MGDDAEFVDDESKRRAALEMLATPDPGPDAGGRGVLLTADQVAMWKSVAKSIKSSRAGLPVAGPGSGDAAQHSADSSSDAHISLSDDSANGLSGGDAANALSETADDEDDGKNFAFL